MSVLRQILQTGELTADSPALAWAALADFEKDAADFAGC